MEVGSAPKTVTSRRRIIYRTSTWLKHNFEVWSGELICRVTVVQMDGSKLIWLGGAGDPELNELALGVPAYGSGLATTLLGADESPAGTMARRLAASLQQHVYLACGASFDRFTLPLVERGLITEIKSRPEYCQ